MKIMIGFAIGWFVAMLAEGIQNRIDTVTVYAQTPHGTSSEETPRGVMDGINTTFTLNFQPLPFSSLHVYLNGLRLHRGVDYTLGGVYSEQIRFIAPEVPQPGDILLADYIY